MVGKLELVDLKKVWLDEAKHFTTWLFDNVEILAENLGIELTALEKEKTVGPFAVDILAEDRDGKSVIIENQLTKTDHDHLGKILTYLSNLDAKTAIWVTSNPRPEHATAINYLNEIVPEDTKFYLVRVQAFRIGDSDPAPLFTVVAGPSPETTAGGKFKKEFAGREQKRFEFFKQLLERSNLRTSLFSNISPTGYQNWVAAGAGKFGMAWIYIIKLSDARVQLDLVASDSDANKVRFKTLQAKQEQIEASFGEPLDWNYSESRKHQNIQSSTKIGGLLDEEKWPEIQDDLVDRMVKLEKSLRDHIAKLA